MDENISTYDLATLYGVISQQKEHPTFWLGFYNSQINFETAEVVFERINRDYLRRAPFVAPNIQAAVNRHDGYSIDTVAPAYIKEKDEFDDTLPFLRRPGETLITGSMTNEQRRDAWVAEFSAMHKTRITKTWEWLAARAAIDGRVTIEGQRYPKSVVDFGRDNSLTLTTDWTAADANALDDLYHMRKTVNGINGVTVRTVIMGDEALAAFMKLHKDDIKDLMDKNFRGSETQISRLLDGFEGIEYVGRFQGVNGAGQFDLFRYSGVQRNPETGEEEALLKPGQVFGINPTEFAGVRAFGAIKDGRAGFKSLDLFPKLWVENEEPWEELFMTQSAPLMVPGNPNATFLINAVADA